MSHRHRIGDCLAEEEEEEEEEGRQLLKRESRESNT
jgi:hypothetical protein